MVGNFAFPLDFLGDSCYNKLMFGKLKRGQHKNLQQSKIQDNILSAASEIAEDIVIQDQIVAYFLGGKQAEILADTTVSVSPEQRVAIQANLAAGKISAANIRDLLLQVPGLQTEADYEQAFQQISKIPREKQILAVATGYNATNWQNVKLEDLKNLLTKPTKGQIDYRTPVGFARFRREFLAGIQEQATPEQMQAYHKSMDHLEQHLYGRRFDFYQQLQLLGQLPKSAEVAKSADPAKARETEASTVPSEEITLQEIITEEAQPEATHLAAPTAASVAQPVSPATAVVLTPITPERSSEILSHAIIEGDPWRQDGNEYRLNTTNLASSGLVPAYEIALDGQTFVFSDPFQLSDGQGAVLGYALVEGGAKVRSFYLDQKTGLWHFAPDIIRGARGEGMSKIGEGYGLASTLLPVVLQQQLSELVRNKGFRELTMVNADFIFAGTAAAYNTQQEYREALSRGQMRSDFYKEVDKAPIAMNWQPSGKNKNVPQLLSVNAELAPNFQAFVNKFTTYSILAGQVNAESFRSADGQAIWLFCSDDWGRSWLGNIEIVSPLTSTGCRRDWLSAGDLATPLYVTSAQAANYGDANDTRKGLVGMWNQYLSKIPVLQEFLTHRGQN